MGYPSSRWMDSSSSARKFFIGTSFESQKSVDLLPAVSDRPEKGFDAQL
jgi:hypothetical protein